MTRSADFFCAAETAAAVLRETRIRTFPVPLKQVLRHCGVRLLPYRDFCREEGCTEEDCFSWFGKDASSIRCGTRFLILYNEKRSPALRIRFSVAHELGHILLGHHAETDEEKRFDRELYELQEEEANCFARNLLCPARALDKLFRLYDYHIDRAVNGAMRIVWQSCRRLTDRTNSQLSDTTLTERAFLLTPTAAEMRLRTLHADLRLTDSRDDRELLQNIRFTATVRCRECGAPWVPGASACYACGTKGRFGFYHAEGRTEPPKGAPYDTLTCCVRLCPVCGKYDHRSGARYCTGCGVNLTNDCEGTASGTGEKIRRHANPPFARYCLRCGKPTSFLRQNLLTEDGKLTLPVAPEKRTQEKTDPEPFSPDCLSLPRQGDRICPRCGTGNRKWRTDCRVCQCPLDNTCPVCGTENTPDARYCLRCGEPTPFERFHAFDIAVQRQERAMARNILALYATRGIYYEWDNGPGQGETF